jgi:lipopolysaccharide transport system ATP-binding protein
MSDTVITVENLSKAYRIGLKEEIPDMLVGAMTSWLKASLHNFRRLQRLDVSRWIAGREQESAEDIIWALKDVSFEVKEGEVVGIIGRNGAGKSTLLKILSRITEPTSGQGIIRGRVSSLLEVGTGFHPDLTGRENIYMNGTILGMTKREVDRKFDEIAAFSGVEKFLDTPIKRYSSGMQVRLAFAVAAHLEPEILIVDEVLAVGDAEFQKKCLGKIQDTATRGRTVLFVSHNMSAIRSLCSRAIYIDDGQIAEDGDPASVSDIYLSAATKMITSAEMDLRAWPNRNGTGTARIVSARLLNNKGEMAGTFNRLAPMTIEYVLESEGSVDMLLSATCFETTNNTKVLQLVHQDTPGFTPGNVKGRQTVRIAIPSLPLQMGNYHWALAIHSQSLMPVDVVSEVLGFIVDDDINISPRSFQSTNNNGLCSLQALWQFVESES